MPIESGAWWFYAKLGFAPRDAATLELARAERSRIEKLVAENAEAKAFLKNLELRRRKYRHAVRHRFEIVEQTDKGNRKLLGEGRTIDGPG